MINSHSPGKNKNLSNQTANTEVLVSVICLCYNHQNTISDCLDSILSQDFSYPYEIIINDDFSSDKSREIIESYKYKYPNIINVVFQRSNQYSKGAFCSMVFDLINKARGKYVAYCECDDFWVYKSKLSYQFSLLENNKNIYMHIMDARAIDVKGESVYESKLKMLGADFKIYSNKELNDNTFLMLQTTMHIKPKELVIKRFYNKTISFDSLLQKILISSAEFKNRCVLVDGNISSVYRVLQTGIWSGLEDHTKFFEVIHGRLVNAQFYHCNENFNLQKLELGCVIVDALKFVGILFFFKIIH